MAVRNKTATHHRQWDQIRAALDKISDAQIGLLVRKAVEDGMNKGWPGLDYDDRAGIRKFLVGVLVS